MADISPDRYNFIALWNAREMDFVIVDSVDGNGLVARLSVGAKRRRLRWVVDRA